MKRDDDYERVHCFPCGGSGRVKGRSSLLASPAKDRRRRKACPDCMGRGFTEQRKRPLIEAQRGKAGR